MKILITVVMFLVVVSNTFANEGTQKTLVDQYIKAVRAEQAISAEIDASVRQYTANSSPEQKAQIERFFNESIGWNSIKDQYAEILGNTYTIEELKTSLAFMKTPIGNSITKKNIEFSRQLSTLMAKNFLALNEKMNTLQDSSPSSDKTQSQFEIVASNIEEHSTDGKTYFTGMIENRGKKSQSGVQVEVNLFMAGKFVDQYSTYIAGSVPPSSQRYFKITCGCKDSPPAPHDSYKIQVINGY